VNADLRSINRVALNNTISERSRKYGSQDLIERLNKAGVPCGPIYRMNEVFEDPQVRHLGLAARVPRPEGDLTLVGPAMRLSRTPSVMKRTIGPAGEHNVEVLRELGYADEEIEVLQADHVI
jgi:formyl-CoA transferase